jgi:protein SCO1/2
MTRTSSPSPDRACCCAVAPPSAQAQSPISGAFDLIDHFGRAVNERSYGDRHLLVFFGFTHCAVVCPRELEKLDRALRLLGPLASGVQPLYITVDPARDDPAAMKHFLSRFNAGFVGLTGTAEQVEAAKKSYRVFAKPVEDAAAPGGYAVPHTAFAYLMAPGGRYGAHFPDSLDAETVAQRMRRHLT